MLGTRAVQAFEQGYRKRYTCAHKRAAWLAPVTPDRQRGAFRENWASRTVMAMTWESPPQRHDHTNGRTILYKLSISCSGVQLAENTQTAVLATLA